jgi:hypothetical protein
MLEQGYTIKQNPVKNNQNPVKNDSSTEVIHRLPNGQDTFNIPASHEERLEWVRKSCERFFEKVREIDALMGRPELN